MSFVNALSLVLCVIGGFLTYLCLGPLAGVIHIWAIFIFTATGVALGGTNEAFKNLVICAFAGIIIAWIGSMIVLNVPLAATLTLPVWAGARRRRNHGVPRVHREHSAVPGDPCDGDRLCDDVRLPVARRRQASDNRKPR